MSVVVRIRRSAFEVAEGTRLLDALLQDGIEVLQVCGGRGLCATCHVRVIEGSGSLSPIGAKEQRTLDRNANTGPDSRLACQTQVVASGAHVEPMGRYIEGIKDLDELVGKRTREPILHPVDGRVLIQRRKIITRTAIAPLRDLDFNPNELDLQD